MRRQMDGCCCCSFALGEILARGSGGLGRMVVRSGLHPGKVCSRKAGNRSLASPCRGEENCAPAKRSSWGGGRVGEGQVRGVGPGLNPRPQEDSPLEGLDMRPEYGPISLPDALQQLGRCAQQAAN